MQPQRSKVIYSPLARSDIVNVGRYHLEKVGAQSAKKITDTLIDTIERLGDFALLGQSHSDPVLAGKGYRKLVLTKTYVAVYKVIDGTVYIYRIVNGATDYPKLLK